MSLTKITLDFETYYADDYSLRQRSMTLTKYIRDPRFKVHGVGIKIENRPSSWVTAKDVPALLDRIPWERIILIGHNLKFDGAILNWHYGKRPALFVDTEGMSRALLGNIPDGFSLDSIAHYLLNKHKGNELALSKNIRDLPPHIENALAGYCITDCDLTYEICKTLWPFFPKSEFSILDWTIRMFTEPMLLLDKQKLLAYRDAVLLRKEELLAAMAHKYGAEVFRSNDKFADLLRSLGVEPPTKQSLTTGKTTYAFAKTDVDFLELQEHENENVALAVQARLGIKTSIAETRALSYAEHADYGAWPVDIKYCGAVATHRFSGSKGGGGNPQNLTRGSPLRDAIHAPDGYVILAGDLSAIELRIAMGLAMQDEALQILRDGGDIYCWFAGSLYSRQITEADEAERFLGKLACLSLQYGCGWQKFQLIAGLKGVRLDDQAAREVVSRYRETFYKIPQLWNWAAVAIQHMYRGEESWLEPARIVRTGLDPFFLSRGERVPCLIMPNGTTIKYPGLRKDSNGQWVYLTRTGRKAHETKLYGGKVIENISQGLAKINICDITTDVRKHIPCAMQVHDELVGIVPEEEALQKQTLMESLMSKSPVWWPDLPVAAKVKYNKSYGAAK